jgi:L-alanine-DL-glutamate epimerase-like enolase superfamily enzyme
MRVEQVTAYTIQEPVATPYRWRRGLPGSGTSHEITWLRLVTDEGIDGWAPVPRGPIALDIIERRLKPLVLGKNPLLKEVLWHEVWEVDRIEEFPIYLLGALDVALWDITAKAANLPLYVLLGGAREEIIAYASTVTFETLEEYFRCAEQCLSLGYKAIKLHAWGDARLDAQLCRELRRFVGDDIVLMYDGSAGFNPYDAFYLGRALEDAGFYWYEEPLREFSINQYRLLCDSLDIPILAAETSDGCHYNAADFIAFGAADMIRVSTHYKGGVTGAMRIAHLADSFQMKAEVHGGGLLHAHLCMAIPNTTFYEALITSLPVVDDPLVSNGIVRAPSLPGIGFEMLIDVHRLPSQAVARL